MSNLVAFKLRHKGTGLFFKPNGASSNVSKGGKIFDSPPSRKSSIAINHTLAKELGIECNSYYVSWDTALDEWEVVAYELIEIKKVNK